MLYSNNAFDVLFEGLKTLIYGWFIAYFTYQWFLMHANLQKNIFGVKDKDRFSQNRCL